MARDLCSRSRNLIESVIETELLSGIVLRYRGDPDETHFSTIREELLDCQYLDGLMSKYSKYVHSQSLELPIEMPEPGELMSDFEELVDWIKAFDTSKKLVRSP